MALITRRQIVARVNPVIFGQVVEQLGRCSYGGLSEEGSALSDRQGYRNDVLVAVGTTKEWNKTVLDILGPIADDHSVHLLGRRKPGPIPLVEPEAGRTRHIMERS